MTETSVVRFGSRAIGAGSPPLLLPDIDLFFNQDMALAERMAKALVETGVEIVKGAVLHRAEIALDDCTEAAFFDGKTMRRERYRDLIARKAVPLDDTEALFSTVQKAGAGFVLSVYDIEGAAFARDIGALALKIPSSNITHEPLIRFAADLRLPLILDTGKSTLEEIARAENWARDAGATGLVIEHSPAAPPAPISEHHLRMIPALTEIFSAPTGLSDHHSGNDMMLAAAALGAAVLEKGVVADDAAIDQDVYHAMRLSEIAGMLVSLTAIHTALGEARRYLPRDRAKPIDRMGLVARHDLEPGATINIKTVDFAFPARGIGTEEWSKVLGWSIVRAVRKGEPIAWSDILSPSGVENPTENAVE